MTMGQKVSGGINRGGSRDASSIFPEHYRRAYERNPAAFGFDFFQDFVRPSRLDVVLCSPPPPKEVQVKFCL